MSLYDEEIVNREFLLKILNLTGYMVSVKDLEHRYLFVNDLWVSEIGVPFEKAIGRPTSEVLPETTCQQIDQKDMLVIETGRESLWEMDIDLPEGKKSYSIQTLPVKNNKGQITAVCTISKNIEDYKRYESSLHQKLISNIGDVIVIIDQEGINRYKSPNVKKLFGWEPEELVGYSTWNNIHPDDLDQVRQFTANLLEKYDNQGNIECRYKCKNGQYKWISFNGTNLCYDRDIQGILGNYHDISIRKMAEKSLKDSEERFKALHNASFGGITIHDKGIILDCNKGLTEISGYSFDELIGMNGLLLIAEESRDTVMEKIQTNYELPYEVQGIRKNKEIYPLRLQARSIPYKGKDVRVVEFRDISEMKQAEQERRSLQEQLLQSQKMESIGRLAGGVAHDFNNMLGVILGYSDLAMEELDPDNPIKKYLMEICDAATRSMNITSQLLAFSRQQAAIPTMLDLNQTIENTISIIQRLIGENISLQWTPGEELWAVKIDPTQIDQILTNLCINARDAIVENGKITISTQNVIRSNEGKKESFVALIVSDNGSGIKKEIQKNLFEPFFTTKEINKGTGLGLAMIYGIVKQNDGLIEVDSEESKGTKFSILLPAYKNLKIKHFSEVRKKTPMARDSEKILLIEDEPAMLAMTASMLEALGYQVIKESSPSKGISLFERHKDTIDILITDVILPEINGKALSEKILEIKPEIKVLFISGYTSDKIGHHGVLNEGTNFLQKPFTRQLLAETVRAILDQE